MKHLRLLGWVKLYVSCSLFITAWVLLTQQPDWMPSREGQYVFAAIAGVLTSLGAADAVVNDLLPERYKACRVASAKYLIFTGIAAFQMALLYAVLVDSVLSLADMRYALDALVATVVAILDFLLQAQARKNAHVEDQDATPAAAHP